MSIMKSVEASEPITTPRVRHSRQGENWERQTYRGEWDEDDVENRSAGRSVRQSRRLILKENKNKGSGRKTVLPARDAVSDSEPAMKPVHVMLKPAPENGKVAPRMKDWDTAASSQARKRTGVDRGGGSQSRSTGSSDKQSPTNARNRPKSRTPERLKKPPALRKKP